MQETTNSCVLEAAVKPPQSGNMVNLPKMILARQDLAMIVTGSAACVRGIYKTVAALGKLHQLHYCVLSDKDYQDGTWVKKYAQLINKVLQREGLGGIIIYAGCLDTLARVNLTKVKPFLHNPAHIPVEILYRGPVAAAVRKPKEVLPELLAKIPLTDGVLSNDGFVLPPLLPDFAGAAALLENNNSSKIILDIGGCSACIAASSRLTFKDLQKTTFNGYVGLKKYQESLDKVILQETQEQAKNSCLLLETPVVKNADLDMAWLKEKLTAKNLEAITLGTTGHKTSIEGIAEALVKLGKQAKSLCSDKAITTIPNLIGVLGATNGQCASKEKINHALEHFAKDGYEALFPETLNWQELDKLATTRLNWVVSSAGLPLAEYLKQEFGIPYFGAIPIGARAMLLWRNQINNMMHNHPIEQLAIPPVTLPAREQKKVLLVGDPILTAGIKRYFIGMEGYVQVDRAIYTPNASLKAFCSQITENEAAWGLQDEALPIQDVPILFKNTETWRKLAAPYDIIVSDKLFQLCLGKEITTKLWINLPEDIFSIGLTAEEDYTIFGKKGVAWLRRAQNLVVATETNM